MYDALSAWWHNVRLREAYVYAHAAGTLIGCPRLTKGCVCCAPLWDIRRMPSGSSALSEPDTNGCGGVRKCGAPHTPADAIESWKSRLWDGSLIHRDTQYEASHRSHNDVSSHGDVSPGHVRDYYNRFFRIPQRTGPTVLHFVLPKYRFKGHGSGLRFVKRPFSNGSCRLNRVGFTEWSSDLINVFSINCEICTNIFVAIVQNITAKNRLYFINFLFFFIYSNISFPIIKQIILLIES